MFEVGWKRDHSSSPYDRPESFTQRQVKLTQTHFVRACSESSGPWCLGIQLGSCLRYPLWHSHVIRPIYCRSDHYTAGINPISPRCPEHLALRLHYAQPCFSSRLLPSFVHTHRAWMKPNIEWRFPRGGILQIFSDDCLRTIFITGCHTDVFSSEHLYRFYNTAIRLLEWKTQWKCKTTSAAQINAAD